MKKLLLIITGLFVLGCIGRCLYMVACVSCTTLPIKIYDYPGSMDKLELQLKAFTNLNHDMNIKTSRRGGDPTDARDIMINIDNNSKNVIYTLGIRDFNGTTQLTLDNIYDERNKIGGDNIDSPKVKILFKDFKKTFLPRLIKEGHIDLDPVFFNF